MRNARHRARGLTLIEVMIASAVMVIMMGLAWRTISNTSDTRRTFEKACTEQGLQLRAALGAVDAHSQAA